MLIGVPKVLRYIGYTDFDIEIPNLFHLDDYVDGRDCNYLVK